VTPAASRSISSSYIRDRPSEAASSPALPDRVELACVGGAYHGRQPQQVWRRQAEFLDYHVESAELAAMAPEHVFDVEGKGIEALADRDNLGRRQEQKQRVGVDESPYQPRTAMRSIFGRAPVTQTVRLCASRAGNFEAGTSGSLAAFQPSKLPPALLLLR
jgi:hypothetical protein